VLDAAALEKKGVHTVTIAWDTFEKAARIAARVQKVPDIRLSIIPHRKGSDTPEIQRAKARAAAPDIVRQLLAS
jgi:hypothetical protein